MIYTSEKLKRLGKPLNEELAIALDENEILQAKVKDEILPNEDLVKGRLESFLGSHVNEIPIFKLEKVNENDEFETVFYLPIRERLKHNSNEILKESCGKLNFNINKIGFLTYQITSMPIKGSYGTETVQYDAEHIALDSIDHQYSNLPEVLAKFIRTMTELESNRDE